MFDNAMAVADDEFSLQGGARIRSLDSVMKIPGRSKEFIGKPPRPGASFWFICVI